MANYSINNTLAGSAQNLAVTYKTLCMVEASTGVQLRRGQIYDILIGTTGIPADNYVQWDISRITANDGTGTSATPVSLNPADAAMAGIAKVNYSAESSTITAASSVFNVGVNQRASYRWVAAPGSEFVYPATNVNGFVLRALSGGYTSTASGQLLVTEL